jgi:hypothetical protein
MSAHARGLASQKGEARRRQCSQLGQPAKRGVDRQRGASAHTVKRAIRTDLTSAHTAVHTRRAGVDPGCEGDVSPDDRNDEAEAAGEVRWLCLRWWVASPAGAFGGVG